jgi:hypothetical protein
MYDNEAKLRTILGASRPSKVGDARRLVTLSEYFWMSRLLSYNIPPSSSAAFPGGGHGVDQPS